MKFEFEALRTIRSYTLKQIESLSTQQLNKIPDGFKNNIVWNLGHLVITQQLLIYKLSKNTPHISLEWIKQYGKNSTPTTSVSEDEIIKLKEAYLNLIPQTEIDFNKQLFTEYIPYKTSMGIELKTVTEAISFNNTHEGVHSGIILGLKKLV